MEVAAGVTGLVLAVNARLATLVYFVSWVSHKSSI